MKLKIGDGVRVLRDGVLVQGVMVTMLSFGHIQDLVEHVGQTGWQAWIYPASIDLLTVSSYRTMRLARRAGEAARMGWFAFLLSGLVSLAANVVDSLASNDAALAVALWHNAALHIIVGAWPPVALVVSTMISHGARRTQAAEAPVEQTLAQEQEQGQEQEDSAPQAPVPASVISVTAPLSTVSEVRAFLDKHPSLRALNQSALHRRIEELCDAALVKAPSSSTVRRAVLP